MKIKQIKAREILDSRGNPTIEVEVVLKNKIKAKASVPSGASTGRHEAWELRDGDRRRYGGKGVLIAVKNVNEKIAPLLIGKKIEKQELLDNLMIKLDSTENKKSLGANAILGVSMACARVAALDQGLPLYRYLRQVGHLKEHGYKMPLPMMNIINGGKHSKNGLDIQELMIIPKNAGTKISERVRVGAEIFQALGKVLAAKGKETGYGDEGGYAPKVNSVDEAIGYIMQAIKDAGYYKRVFLGVDAGSSEFFNSKSKRYDLKLEKRSFSSSEMIDFYKDWLEKYPFISLEDPLAEDDWQGWQMMTKETGRKVMLVGDDLFATNMNRLNKGIQAKAANAILIKLNQIGTVSETLKCVEQAKVNGYKTVISHRSGETNDDFIADLAVACNSEYIKTGAPNRGERVAKYNRLMEIEAELG